MTAPLPTAPNGARAESDDYRPVSRLAVAAVGLGACSAAALLHPLCWALPLVAAAVAVAALADVRRHGRAGGLAASAGLALAVGFGAQAVSHAAVQRLLAERRAVAAARMWIDAVREGRPADAAAMTGGDAGADAAAVDAAVQGIQACGAPGAVVATRAAPDGESAGAWRVVLAVRPCDAGGEVEVTMRLGVMPIPGRGGERWLVTDVRTGPRP
jgi:hypothetical protein